MGMNQLLERLYTSVTDPSSGLHTQVLSVDGESNRDLQVPLLAAEIKAEVFGGQHSPSNPSPMNDLFELSVSVYLSNLAFNGKIVAQHHRPAGELC